MKKSIRRRNFVRHIGLGTLSVATLGACSGGENPQHRDGDIQKESSFEEELAKMRKMPRDLVMKMLDQKVDQYMQRSHHCAQSSFLALREQFGLKGKEVFRALTPLPGIAERGETCGALTGPLMAMGLIYGRDIHQMENWDTYRASLVPAE